MTGILNKRPERFVETEIDDEVVVMDLSSGNFFSLKDSGLEIWRLIDGARDRAGITAALAATYAVTDSEIAEDVGAFLDQVLAAGLIEAQ